MSGLGEKSHDLRSVGDVWSLPYPCWTTDFVKGTVASFYPKIGSYLLAAAIVRHRIRYAAINGMISSSNERALVKAHVRMGGSPNDEALSNALHLAFLVHDARRRESSRMNASSASSSSAGTIRSRSFVELCERAEQAMKAAVCADQVAVQLPCSGAGTWSKTTQKDAMLGVSIDAMGLSWVEPLSGTLLQPWRGAGAPSLSSSHPLVEARTRRIHRSIRHPMFDSDGSLSLHLPGAVSDLQDVLSPGGSHPVPREIDHDVMLVSDDVDLFVDAWGRYIAWDGIRPQLLALIDGMEDVCVAPHLVVGALMPHESTQLVCGGSRIEWTEEELD